MDDEPYVPPVHGSDRFNQARADRVARTGESDVDDPEFALIYPQRSDDFLYPGCVIKYTAIPFMRNSTYNQRVAVIVSTDPQRMPSSSMISLNNGDSLPNDTRVSIIARIVGDIVCPVENPMRCLSRTTS
jgi:hypothetical protein